MHLTSGICLERRLALLVIQFVDLGFIVYHKYYLCEVICFKTQ